MAREGFAGIHIVDAVQESLSNRPGGFIRLVWWLLL